MPNFGDIETEADTPFGEVDISNPLGATTKVVLGAAMTAVGFGGGMYAYNKIKSQAGVDNFQIPGAENL